MSASGESGFSRRIRQTSGVVSLAALPAAILFALAGNEDAAPVAALVFFAVPWVVFIAHLNLTRAITNDDKTTWRRELWSSPRSVIAVYAYLFSNDLAARARGFGAYRKDEEE